MNDETTRSGQTESADIVRRFLQLCLRTRLDPQVLDDVRELAASPDLSWRDVVWVAQGERLLPLLSHGLHERGILPAEIDAMLQPAYHATSRRNLSLLHEFAQALALLSAAGIDVVVLKGVALIEAVYRNLGLRPLADVDVLLKREDVARAVEVLEAAGFFVATTEPREGAAIEYENELVLRKPGRVDLILELHWSLFNSPFYQHRLSLEWFRETARPLVVRGSPTFTLGPEAQVLYLCGHLALHHDGRKLLWLHDIAELLTAFQTEIAWEVLLTKAQQNDLMIPLKVVLTRVVSEWMVPVPPHVLERLDGLQPSADEQSAWHTLTRENPSVAERFWADIAAIPEWRTRARFLWTNVFPSPAYMQQRYGIRHRVVIPLFYPYRWARGLRSAL